VPHAAEYRRTPPPSPFPSSNMLDWNQRVCDKQSIQVSGGPLSVCDLTARINTIGPFMTSHFQSFPASHSQCDPPLSDPSRRNRVLPQVSRCRLTPSANAIHSFDRQKGRSMIPSKTLFAFTAFFLAIPVFETHWVSHPICPSLSSTPARFQM